MDIIKLGGSVITDKKKYRKLNFKNLQNLTKSIAKWGKNCIVVHGAGSFGHILAAKYSINSGYHSEEQLCGISQIRLDMSYLNERIVETLNLNGLNAIGFQTSAFVYGQEDNQLIYLLDPLKKAIELGLLPVVYGDVLFSDNEGISIYSGDNLIELLVKNFDIKRVIFITDVDGLLIENKEKQSFSLVEEINSDNLQQIDFNESLTEKTIDVTGNMKGKFTAIISIMKYVEKVVIVNGNYLERVEKVLADRKTMATIITK
ncbi:MAG: isopentenyl phosphate kinase [Candidatus Heimdallarchaeaceae archaeon]